MVRPRKGSHSAGLIIWFETSGGRGFDKGLFREPRPRHLGKYLVVFQTLERLCRFRWRYVWLYVGSGQGIPRVFD